MRRGVVLDYKEGLATVKAVANLAKSDRHFELAGQALMVYRNKEAVGQIFGDDQPILHSDYLFLRAESGTALMQLNIPCSGTEMEDGWRAVVPISKLVEALNVLQKKRIANVEVAVLKTGIRIGKITIRTKDPGMFAKPPMGISQATDQGLIPNPHSSVARVQHCTGDEGVAAIAILPGQLLAAYRAQAIIVDCDLLGSDQHDLKLMVSAKDLLRCKALGDTLQVRVSPNYLVLRGIKGLLGMRRQRWSKTMDEALALFHDTEFVDEIEAERAGLQEALQTAMRVLGKDADAEITFGEQGHLRSVEEGNEVQFDFDCKVKSGAHYSLGLMVRMLLKAVEFAPETTIVFKVPDLTRGPVNMIHLVDSESHEVIALGTTGQLRQKEETDESADGTGPG